jgi:hypothetical protein
MPWSRFCEPPEYKLNNEAQFSIIEEINILINCSADNPILINKVITHWLRLVCGMLQKQQELLGSFFFSDHKFTAICNTHWHPFLNTCPITSKPRTFTAMNYNSAHSKHFYMLFTRFFGDRIINLELWLPTLSGLSLYHFCVWAC